MADKNRTWTDVIAKAIDLNCVIALVIILIWLSVCDKGQRISDHYYPRNTIPAPAEGE